MYKTVTVTLVTVIVTNTMVNVSDYLEGVDEGVLSLHPHPHLYTLNLTPSHPHPLVCCEYPCNGCADAKQERTKENEICIFPALQQTIHQ